MIAMLLVVSLAYSFSYFTSGLYWACEGLAGLDESELMQRMGEYEQPPYYVEKQPYGGTYGWYGRLTYDSAVVVGHHSRNYECRILLKGGVVVNEERAFE
jgi:hypothetical protein